MAELRSEPQLRCERCGQFGAYAFDGHDVCADCCAERGACCIEFDPLSNGEDGDRKEP